jgi:hypothetical protein
VAAHNTSAAAGAPGEGLRRRSDGLSLARWVCLRPGFTERNEVDEMSHERDVRPAETGDGVGTDGSLHSPDEPTFDHGADRSAEKSDGVGTDGSLDNPDNVNPDNPVTDRDAETRRH